MIILTMTKWGNAEDPVQEPVLFAMFINDSEIRESCKVITLWVIQRRK